MWSLLSATLVPSGVCQAKQKGNRGAEGAEAQRVGTCPPEAGLLGVGGVNLPDFYLHPKNALTTHGESDSAVSVCLSVHSSVHSCVCACMCVDRPGKERCVEAQERVVINSWDSF